jgi:diguanylate cyclase (GGDEF)-like protein
MKGYTITHFRRFFLIPLVITGFITLLLSISLYEITNENFKAIYAKSSENFSKAYAEIVNEHHEFIDHIYDDFYTRLDTAAKTVLYNRDKLSNAYLSEVADTHHVYTIWWYTPDATVIYDSSEAFIGWQAKENDPIYTFMESGLVSFKEGIRASTDTDQSFLVYYLRADDGYFVQVVLDADYVLSYVNEHQYQASLEYIVNTNVHINYAFIMSSQNFIVADTRSHRGRNLADPYEEALSGKTVSREVFDSSSNLQILEVATPIREGDISDGVLVVGYSLHFYKDVNFYLSLVILMVGVGTIIVFSVLQYIQVIHPLIKLDTAIVSFNSKDGDYVKPKGNISVFKHTFNALNNLSERIKDSNLEHAKLNHKIHSLALTDYLTKMPNRMHLADVIDSYIEKVETFAVIFVDLDDFKTYNDTKGHIFGDHLLINVTEVLKKPLYKDLFIARYGGDEFVILYKFQNIDDVELIVRSLYEDFKDPLIIQEGEYPIDLSVGIALSPLNGVSSTELIRKADIAMYQSKRRGKNMFTFYEDEMNDMVQEDARIVASIRKALREDGFKVLIQPQVNIHTNDIVSYEALARFKEENISPSKFIPIAEQSNLIIELGRVIITKTLKVLKAMKDNHIPLKTIYVNFSTLQMEDHHIIDFIKESLELYGIKPQYLGIELTESMLIKNDHEAILFLERVKELGLKLAIDDFGSGQSSLNYLVKYPLELVKLDRSFSSYYLTEENLEIFNAVINLAQLLKFNVLAEGIEEECQLKLLKETKCELVQGFIYYEPLEVKDLLEHLKDNKKA